MSLIERALRKMQESGGPAPRPAPATARAPSVAPPVVHPVPTSTRTAAPVIRIDRSALRAAEILAPQAQEKQIAEEYRQIKRPLIANALGRGTPALPDGHLIMLASALPGDGKTFTSINLAMSMAAEQDISVVLVDADVAKPHVSRIFGIQSAPGLLDLLRDESLDVESVIQRTDIAGLSLVSAGNSSSNATELLASDRMATIAAQIAAHESNRIVLFDSPPLLLTSESRALAGMVGQIVLVVRAGLTPQQAVFESLELLGEGRSVNLVLNQSDAPNSAGYYRYYDNDMADQPAPPVDAGSSAP